MAQLASGLSVGITSRRVERFTDEYYGVPVPLISRLEQLGVRAIPLVPGASARQISDMCDALILSGGESLGDDVERDEFEFELIELFLGGNKPIFGICRGMQILTTFFGSKVHRVLGHAGVQNLIYPTFGLGNPFNVTCYHNFSVRALGKNMLVTAQSADGNCESADFVDSSCSGVMWHPEREPTNSEGWLWLERRIVTWDQMK